MYITTCIASITRYYYFKTKYINEEIKK